MRRRPRPSDPAQLTPQVGVPVQGDQAVGYQVCMRVHISLDDELVRDLDKLVGPRQRSAFIVAAVREALDQQQRLELLESAIGSISDEGHEWDPDPGEWVRAQRRADPHRVG
jgi:Arc/MetJ-type ribon-helix-helix transcriptional regulator